MKTFTLESILRMKTDWKKPCFIINPHTPIRLRSTMDGQPISMENGGAEWARQEEHSSSMLA